MGLGNLSDLQDECARFGLTPIGSGKNGKVKKMDCLKALEGYYLSGLESQGLLLPGCKWIHSTIDSPQLAEPQTVFSTANQFKEFIGRDDISGEEKCDGVRILISYFPGVGFELFSRNRSVENYLFGSYNDQVYGWDQETTRDILPFAFVIDGELISLNPSVNGRIVIDTMLAAVVAMLGMNRLDSHRMQAEAGYPLRYEAFDCIMFDGKPLLNESLLTRRKYLGEVVAKLHEAADRLSLPQLKWIEPLRIVRGGYQDKLSFYQEVTARGGEGLVLKADGSVYSGKEARGGLGAGFIKWKRNTSESVGGSIDAFIDGRFTPGEGKFSGMVGAVGFSVHLLPSGEVHPIALVSGISDDMRRSITSQDSNGLVIVNPAWVGRVAEIEGQDVSSKSRSLSHARILRFRDGADSKSPAQCVLQESVLNDMIL
jgi:ATP-dependent DNA ligase